MTAPAIRWPNPRFIWPSARPTTPREHTTSTRWTLRMRRIQAAPASRIIPRLEPISMDSISARMNSISPIGFVDASILAISKASLAAGLAQPTAFEFLVPFNTYEFAIHPATTPPGASYFLAKRAASSTLSAARRQSRQHDGDLRHVEYQFPGNGDSQSDSYRNVGADAGLLEPAGSHATAERPDSPTGHPWGSRSRVHSMAAIRVFNR